MSLSSSYLSCRDICLRVGNITLVSRLSLSLLRGRSLSLVGPNGCGKTTLLRVFSGISRPHHGTVKVMGEEIWPSRQVNYEHNAVFLAHSPAFLSDHSVLCNLEFYIRAFAVKFSLDESCAALKKVGLYGRENQIARTLSAGQKRRLTLAALLVLRPHLVFADEPTNGLDTEGSFLCIEIFEYLKSVIGSVIVVATHDDRMIQWCHDSLNLVSFSPTKKNVKNMIRSLD